MATTRVLAAPELLSESCESQSHMIPSWEILIQKWQFAVTVASCKLRPKEIVVGDRKARGVFRVLLWMYVPKKDFVVTFARNQQTQKPHAELVGG